MVNKKQKILLIVEGSKQEVRLFKHLFKEYNLALNYEIFPYRTNIYELYERMFKGNEDSLDTLDLIQILKSKDPDNMLLNDNFSDIILVFDYDPQDGGFSSEKIELMLNYFNESTDNGKLYINYPMVESFKHFISFPDETYKDRTVSMETLINCDYKRIVGKEAAITDIRRFDKYLFTQVIIQNIMKSYYILKNKYCNDNIHDLYQNLDLSKILHIQNRLCIENNEFYVLNTCIFFITDYKFSLIDDAYKEL